MASTDRGHRTLGALLDLTSTTTLILRDYWTGYHAQAPFTAVFELRRDGSGPFAGAGTLATRNHGPTSVDVALTRPATRKLLATLASARVEDGEYVPFMDHTDDMPSIELVLHTASGIALVFSRSQGEFHAPWGACIGGALYTLPGEEVGRALAALRGPLQLDRLQVMAEAADEREAEEAPASALTLDDVQAEMFAALWMKGAVSKDEAVRLCAARFRERAWLTYKRLRADGRDYARVLEFVEGAVKAGVLERPGRGLIRASKPDAAAYTKDDWRAVLLASLGAAPVDRDAAIRDAAEWARDQLGLAFTRLRADGDIAQGLRTAINSAIRRGEIQRHGASIARAQGSASEAAAPEAPTDESPDEATDGPTVDAEDGVSELPRPIIETLTEPRHFDGTESVLVLQMSESDPPIDRYFFVNGLVADVLGTHQPDAGASWRFYFAVERLHVEQLGTWLGISRDVPAVVTDLIQVVLKGMGWQVQREYAEVAHHELVPIYHVTAGALEVPSRGAFFLGESELGELPLTRVVRRPFVVDGSRGAADGWLEAWLLSKGLDA